MPRKFFSEADLSGWLSPDEDRLLAKFRDLSEEACSEYLYRLTRERFLTNYLEKYDVVADRAECADYTELLVEALEQFSPENGPEELKFWGGEPSWTEYVYNAWD